MYSPGDKVLYGYKRELVFSPEGLLYHASDEVRYTIDLYVFQYGTQNLEIGLGTAAGIFKSIVAIILLTGANFISRRLGEDSLI